MSDLLSRALVRIFSQGDDSIVGTGFLVADNSVLTCAHVICNALGMESNSLLSPEDFLEGFRPEANGGQMQFVARSGIFKQLCRDASAAPHEKF